MQTLAIETNALRMLMFGTGTQTVFTTERHMISCLIR